MTTRLLYVADPMCSWCFGFAPLIHGIRPLLRTEVEFRLVLGGLAPDSREPMNEETKEYIRGAWAQIEERTGVSFNWTYWERCQPRRSTWPACRAVLVAGDRGEEMYSAIQQAYYRDARDPSDPEVLVALAIELGLDEADFRGALDHEDTRSRLNQEFALRDRLGARGYPSLGLERAGEFRMLSQGWIDAGPLGALLAREGLLEKPA